MELDHCLCAKVQACKEEQEYRIHQLIEHPGPSGGTRLGNHLPYPALEKLVEGLRALHVSEEDIAGVKKDFNSGKTSTEYLSAAFEPEQWAKLSQ